MRIVYSNSTSPCETVSYVTWYLRRWWMLTRGDCLCLSAQGLITPAFEWPKPIVSDWPRVFMQPLPLSLSVVITKTSSSSRRLWVSWSSFSVTVCFGDFYVTFTDRGWYSYMLGNVLHVLASCSSFPPFCLHDSSGFYLLRCAVAEKRRFILLCHYFHFYARFARHFIK